MKRWLISLFCVCLFHPVYAFELENKMFLTEHYLSYTTSFDVSTDERKLGTLYRRVLSLNTVYDFYDIKNKLLATAQSHFFSFGAHLDIFDDNKVLLGTVEEKVFTWFPSFDIYSPDGVRLASATMNFWGTTFTLYDGRSTRELAKMSRDFFRLRNSWTIDIQQLDRVKEKQIDARLLLTVLAVQGDIEYLEQYRNRERERSRGRSDPFNLYPQARRLTATEAPQEAIADSRQPLHNKYADFLKKEAELKDIALPDAQQLNGLAEQLDQDFQQQYAGTTLNSAEQTEQFVEYCINVAQSASTTLDTQKAILHLLNKRLAEQTGK